MDCLDVQHPGDEAEITCHHRGARLGKHNGLRLGIALDEGLHGSLGVFFIGGNLTELRPQNFVHVSEHSAAQTDVFRRSVHIPVGGIHHDLRPLFPGGEPAVAADVTVQPHDFNIFVTVQQIDGFG